MENQLPVKVWCCLDLLEPWMGVGFILMCMKLGDSILVYEIVSYSFMVVDSLNLLTPNI